MLKLAVQKSGRLLEGSLDLLKSCGIKIDNGEDRLRVTATHFPMELYFLRNSDIPQYVQDGIADIAILGENTLVEKNREMDKIRNAMPLKITIERDINEDIEVLKLEEIIDKE